MLTWLTAILEAGFAKSLALNAGNKTVFGKKFKMRDFREKRAGVRDQDPPLAPSPPPPPPPRPPPPPPPAFLTTRIVLQTDKTCWFSVGFRWIRRPRKRS